MQITHTLSVMTVRDHDEAVAWYSALFGRGPDRRPMPPSAEWDLGAGSGVQVYLDPDHAGDHHMIIGVADLDETLAELSGRGIDGEAFTVPSGQFRLAMLADPSDNSVILARELDPDPAST